MKTSKTTEKQAQLTEQELETVTGGVYWPDGDCTTPFIPFGPRPKPMPKLPFPV